MGKVAVKRDNVRNARLILVGPVGNWMYEQLYKTDYDRQVDAIQRMQKEGMKHGCVKMSSKRGGKMYTKYGDTAYTQQHDGEYRW